MTTREHLLTILAEECAEIAQRCSKALRFGLDEKQTGQPMTNGERIMEEVDDFAGVVRMLQERGELPLGRPDRVIAKQDRVRHFLKYSREQGTLKDAK